MKKLIIISAFLIALLPTFSQDSVVLSNESAISLTNDIKLLNQRLEKMIKLNDSLAEYNDKLIRNNYSLNNQLKAEQFKGELFEGVLAEQTYRFLFLALLLAGSAAGIAIYAIRDKGKDLEIKFNKAVEDISKATSKTILKQEGLEKRLFTSLANINYNLGKQFASEQNHLAAVNYLLKSIDYTYRSISDSKFKIIDNQSGMVIRLLSILNMVSEYIDLLPKSDIGIEKYRALFPDFIESLESITRTVNPELNKSATLLKSKIIQIEKI